MRSAFVAAAAGCVVAAACAGVSTTRMQPGDVASFEIPGRGLTAGSDGLVAINGTRLFVHREGSGEPAIVIHGGPLLDHGYLRPHLAPLGDELELIFYDQRLSGRSAGVLDSASVRLDTFVEDIETLRAAAGAERVHLIAHSWGGLLAMKYAAAYPERLRTMVLISPMAPSSALWQQEQAAQAARLTPADTAGAGALRTSPGFAAREPAAVEAVLRHSFRSEFHDPARAADLRFHIEPDYAQRTRQFGYMLPDLMSYDLVSDLAEVDVPTLIIYGADEVGAPVGGDALAKALPEARLVVLDDVGHFAFIEKPVDVLRAIRAHVRRD